MVPVSWFEERARNVKFVSLPSSGGMESVRLLLLSKRLVKFVSLPSSGGMEPSSS